MGCKWSGPAEGRGFDDAETHAPKARSPHATYAALFLEKLGLPQYIGDFEKAGFENVQAVHKLCQQDLDEIEKYSGNDILPGHRKVLIQAALYLRGPDMKELSKSLARHRIMLDATQQDMSSPVSLQGGPTTQHEAQQQHQQRQWQQHASGEVQSAPSDHDSSEAMSPVSQHIGGIQWHQPPPNGSQETRYRPGWTAADHMSVLRNQGQAGGLCATTYPTSSQPQVVHPEPPRPLEDILQTAEGMSMYATCVSLPFSNRTEESGPVTADHLLNTSTFSNSSHFSYGEDNPISRLSPEMSARLTDYLGNLMDTTELVDGMQARGISPFGQQQPEGAPQARPGGTQGTGPPSGFSAQAAVAPRRSGSEGFDGRDPHPTALRVVQEIKRMRSRAASGADAMEPDREGVLGLQAEAVSGAATCRPGRISVQQQLQDPSPNTVNNQKTAWVIPW
ncbi:hypothetical protein WJX84_003932 [Apatococcus fuscideae]|uniref:SAM domain-containing protein n=1 Tax=Apatococcus fuscideae TaxID=2026836 RepID=A0AAW1ST91_9CHLO